MDNKGLKKLTFGIGTGRCGTVSLCQLLNHQEYANFTHEERPLLSWKNSEKKMISLRINKILKRDGLYVGDIAFFYLPYIETILDIYPDAKIICLKRKKEEVITSYMKKTKGRNHWVKHYGIFWEKCEWDKCYPSYKKILKKNALKKYWEDYYSTVDKLLSHYPNSIKIMDMHRIYRYK